MAIDREDSPSSGDAERASAGTRVQCPTCGVRAAWHGNPHRPFCSLTCRLIDLGLWLDERHRIEGDAGSDAGHDHVP